MNKYKYPYKRLNYTDEQIHEMFDKLSKYDYKSRILIKEYSIKNINYDKPMFMNKPMLLINSGNDYNDFNLLSDMFQEKCRLKCKLYYQKLSSEEYFNKYYNKVIAYSTEHYSNKITPQSLRESLYYLNKECTSHRPNIIIAMIQLFGAKSVLDFSAGWGDRLIGAMAADVDYYCGIDPNPCLHPNYQEMIKFFGKSSKKFVMIESTIEDAKLPDKEFDLIFTSPPYFDLEIYAKNNKQSSKHTNEKLWFDNFFKIALTKVWGKLRHGGVMCININQKSKEEYYIQWMLDFVKTFGDSYYLGVISYGSKDLTNPQPIWIWKKK